MSDEGRNITVLSEIDASPFETNLTLTEVASTPEDNPLIPAEEKGDNNFVEAPTVETTELPTVETEEEEVEMNTEPPHAEDQPTVENEEDYSGYTNAQLLGLEFQEDGVLGADVDVSELDADGLKKAILDSLTQRAEVEAEQRLSQRAASDKDYDYAQMVFNGAQDEELVHARTLDQLSNLPLDDDQENADQIREHLIKQYYLAQNISEKRADKLLATVLEDGEDLEEAKAAKEYFATESKKLKQEIQQRGEAARKEREKQVKEYENTIVSKLDSGKIGDAEWSEDVRKKIKSGIFDKTERITGPDGQTQYVSLYQKKMSEFQNDPDKELMFARMLLLDEWNTEKIISSAENNHAKKFRKALDTKPVRQQKPEQTPQKNSKRKITPLTTFDM